MNSRGVEFRILGMGGFARILFSKSSFIMAGEYGRLNSCVTPSIQAKASTISYIRIGESFLIARTVKIGRRLERGFAKYSAWWSGLKFEIFKELAEVLPPSIASAMGEPPSDPTVKGRPDHPARLPIF